MADKYFYSAKENGFYSESLRSEYEHSETGWPADAIEISDRRYKQLMEGQSQGKVIVANEDGLPVLVEPPEPTKEQLISEAEEQKKRLMEEAAEAIAPLQDAVDLSLATEQELADFAAWKRYRVLLNRVDTSKAPEIEWPDKPAIG